jgi:hypothetical protein
LFHALKRHPIPVRAFFRHSLVLTYAFSAEVLEPLLPPGLTLDRWQEWGFVAVALVQTEELRPAFLPRVFGRRFFLSGYRIFARYTTRAGQRLRGLRILRSDTDSRVMAFAGNALTHYNYRKADVARQHRDGTLALSIRTPGGEADLDVTADLASDVAAPPAGSPFPDLAIARRFAGPLPYTFDYERQTHSVILIEGVRSEWNPRPVSVRVDQCAFLGQPMFGGATPVLANAFHLAGVPYEWRRGRRELLER